MSDEVKMLWELFEALLVPNRVINNMLDIYAQSEHKEVYICLWEDLMNLETKVLRLKYSLAEKQMRKDEEEKEDVEGYQE